MRSFEFIAPTDVAEARAVLGEHGADAVPMAGGQSLLLKMKPRLASPQTVVHIGRLPQLRGWAYADGTLTLGSATTYSTLEDAEPLRGGHELLRSIAGDLADRAVRNLGTIGGAVNACAPAFDVPVALLALDARLVLRSAQQERDLGVDAFVLGDGVTARRPDELMEQIVLPSREGWRWAFEKFRRRLIDAATASVAVMVRPDDSGKIDEARVVVGAVGEVPLRLAAVESALTGRTLDTPTIEDATTLAGDEVAPRCRRTLACSPAYARHLVVALTRRALTRVAERPERGE